MRKYLITMFLLAAASGCERNADRDDNLDDRVATRDDDENDAYVRSLRARIDELGRRIDNIEDRDDEESKSAAARLRARMSDLETKLARAGDRAGSEWDELKADVEREYEELKADIDERF